MVKRLCEAVEKILHMAVLLLLMDFFLPLWNEMHGVEDAPGMEPEQVFMVGFVLVFTAYVIVTAPGKTFRTAVRTPLLLALLLWAALSFLWSEAPDMTLQRTVGVALTAVYAVALRLRFADEDLLKLLGWTVLVALATSFLLVAAAPHWAVMEFPHEGAWNGAFLHKNVLGRIAASGLLFFAFLRWIDKRPGLWNGALALAALCLWRSESASSLVLVCALAGMGIALWELPRRTQWNGSTVLVVVLGLATAGYYAVLNFDLILHILRRDVTLTGRTPLWAVLLPMLRDRFWTGYGFRAFWLGWDGPSAEVYKAMTWFPEHAHNGFLDLWLELGFVGVILGLGLLLSPLAFHGRAALQGRPTAIFWVLLGLFVLLYNLPESYFMRPNSILWLLAVAAATAPETQEKGP
jgi:O-antigen ligase